MEPGEKEAVEKRIFEVLEDSSLEVTIRMNHPENEAGMGRANMIEPPLERDI
jgi:hypothetical protein